MRNRTSLLFTSSALSLPGIADGGTATYRTVSLEGVHAPAMMLLVGFLPFRLSAFPPSGSFPRISSPSSFVLTLFFAHPFSLLICSLSFPVDSTLLDYCIVIGHSGLDTMSALIYTFLLVTDGQIPPTLLSHACRSGRYVAGMEVGNGAPSRSCL